MHYCIGVFGPGMLLIYPTARYDSYTNIGSKLVLDWKLPDIYDSEILEHVSY